MKRATFKKPFNGMDNALKLIPESYKVDGNEFQITDGIETYNIRLKEGRIFSREFGAESSKAILNEPSVITS